ncbi:hypothetical protein VIGAN_08191000 [Vigna angularis var. angularis]|uniref:Exocyst complex subunit Exo70 C-terminal domain-containing protein n=1 Tax=Vigna angularis var. angularis TaxID=157739 RepID=A0A0S3SQW8_PHAAN|nr:hypothetical protein VIGAN_08191000 [Vigna angularis var. angularis]
MKKRKEVLELKIKKWLNAVKVAVGTLFHGERILADHVFSSNPEKRISKSWFAEITNPEEDEIQPFAIHLQFSFQLK